MASVTAPLVPRSVMPWIPAAEVPAGDHVPITECPVPQLWNGTVMVDGEGGGTA